MARRRRGWVVPRGRYTRGWPRHDNSYAGPWTFIGYTANRVLEIGEWEGSPYSQDSGSTYTAQGGG